MQAVRSLAVLGGKRANLGPLLSDKGAHEMTDIPAMPAELFGGDMAPWDESEPMSWRIEDEGAAAWVLAKLAEAQSVIDAAGEKASEWRDRVNAWEARETEQARGTTSWAVPESNRKTVSRSPVSAE